MIAHKHGIVFNNYDIDRARSTLLFTVSNGNTICACVYFAANVGKLSYLLIVLMGHTMFVNVQYISSASI